MANERRVAEDVAAFLRREDLVPVEAEGVTGTDGRRFFQRDTRVVPAEGLGKGHVDLMVGEPESGFGDQRGELFQFDPVELVDIDAREIADFQAEWQLIAVDRLKHFKFEGTQFTIGDDEKVAAPTGGIEKAKGGEALVKAVKGRRRRFTFFVRSGRGEIGRTNRREPVSGGRAEFLKLGLQLIEEEWVDDAADVFLGGVVGAFGAALFLVHHTLEERAEDAGRDAAPVEAAAGEKGGSLTSGHGGDVEFFGEEFAVDVGEDGEFGGKMGGP